MSGRKKGWDLAQLRTSFLADPEFIRLRMACRGDTQFLAAVGLWTIALAQAWREDDGDVADLAAAYPKQAATLEEAQLVVAGQFRGFEAWVGEVRQRREDDAARKRGARPPALDSAGVQRNPVESSGVLREEGRGSGSGEVSPSVRDARTRDGLADISDEVVEAWGVAAGRSILGSGRYAQDYLSDASRRHSAATVTAGIRRARQSFDHIPAAQPLAGALQRILDPFLDSKTTAAADAEKREQVRSRRAIEGTIRTAHGAGFHDETADPRCPLCKEGP